MSEGFESPLASGIDRFLTAKRSLGRKYETEEWALRLFDRYLAERDVQTLDEVTAEVVSAFLASRPRPRPRSFNHLVGVIRRLFDWLLLHQEIERPPQLPRPRRQTTSRLAFIFDIEQAKRLLSLAGSLPESRRAPARGPTYQMVFALLYGLGLRVGEASRLSCSDLDWERRLLVVRETKFAKSRLVPFGPRMGSTLDRYLDRIRPRRGVLAPDAPLFSFSRGQPMSTSAVGAAFRELRPRLALDVPPGIGTPRLHDLRHSFAVGTLLRWYRQGVDPRDRLLQLSTFMGHVHPDSTAVYLQITDALLAEAGDRFEQYVLTDPT